MLGAASTTGVHKGVSGRKGVRQKDAWFSEKYDPEVLSLLEKDRKELARANSQQFFNEFGRGVFADIDLTTSNPVVSVLDRQRWVQLSK